jgi:hypothetical protein
MGLFVDGPACTIEDLTEQDSGLLDVSQTNGINLAAKLRLAQEEIGTELQLWLDQQKPGIELIGEPAWRIGQIVATPPLKRWEAMHALELVYRDAYFSQLIDRYQAKWQEFTRLSGDAREKFVAIGMGLVQDPMPKAKPPALVVSQAPQSGGTFYASVAWVNSGGQEGEASPAASITFPDGHLMSVAAIDPPKSAAGFNVYAGPSPYGMCLQNETLVPVNVAYQYLPGQPMEGRRPGNGQRPDFMRPILRLWSRG